MQMQANLVSGRTSFWRNLTAALAVALLAFVARPAQAADGRIVVSHDEWILSEAGFSSLPSDTANYAINLTSWLTAGKPNARVLAYSENFGFTGPSLAATMANAGYTYVVSATVPTDLASLLQYDAIFLGGSALDNQTLIDYVRAGGSVYVTAGTGLNFPDEAGAWNPFLTTFGLRYINPYNLIGGILPVTSSHAIFNGVSTLVSSLFHNNGNTVQEVSPTNVKTSMILDLGGIGLVAIYDPSATSDVWPIDAITGLSPNIISTLRSPAVTTVALTGVPGRDLSLIDTSTIRIMGLTPLSNIVADVSSPYVGTSGIDAGANSRADGVNDLVFYLDTTALLNLLTPVVDGSAVTLTLTGSYVGGGAINGQDLLVTIARVPGSIIIGHDDWAFSDLGQTIAPDSSKLLINIAGYFAGGAAGDFLYRRGVAAAGYEGAFVQTLNAASHTATATTEPFTLGQLQNYDGLFLGGNQENTTVLINYVLLGGNVYISGGLSPVGNDSVYYNEFLNFFGLSLGTTHNALIGVKSVSSTNVLFTGVNSMYSALGSTMSLLDPSNPETIELAYTEGLLTHVQFKPLPNRSPITGSDSASTLQNVPVTIPVLANDVDPERQFFSLVDLVQPANGSAVIDGTNVVFTPAPGFAGTTTFSYIVADTSGGTSTGLVTVAVIAANHAPVANNGTFTLAKNTSLTNAVTASDVDGDALTYSVVSSPASGTLTLSPTGNFVYKPVSNFTGNVSFTFRASDGALSATGTVSIAVISTTPVNNPPVAVNDTATVQQGGSVTINVLANDSDPNGDSLVITAATASNGSVVISSGKLVYTPSSSFSGTATLNYTISDGKGGTASATVTVTVTPKPAPGCDVYPIALAWDKVRCADPGDILKDIYNGNRPGNFGWLTWAGSPSTPTLVTSLGIPGNSHTYINPYNSSDRKISVGDWVQGSPGVANSSNVRAALDKLKTIDIVVPVYDKSRCSGNNALFHVVAFAKVRIQSYSLPGTNKITAKFLGLVDCNNDCNYRRDCDDRDDDDYDRNDKNRKDHDRHGHDSKGRCRN